MLLNHCRLVRIGPAKRPSKKMASDSDHWGPGGVEITSEFEENKDDDLVEYLRSQATFLAQMSATGAFTDACLVMVIGGDFMAAPGGPFLVTGPFETPTALSGLEGPRPEVLASGKRLGHLPVLPRVVSDAQPPKCSIESWIKGAVLCKSGREGTPAFYADGTTSGRSS